MSQPYVSIQYDTLKNKTFSGFLIAEFLAAFNDQCIHASAMFFAIRKQALTESDAIVLMPLLFYSPWAIFATLSGYFADKYSKRSSLIFWKVAEVAITGLALLGFWMGTAFTGTDVGAIGPFVVMACVFLMGTHSAFYVPAKYGVLPEIFTVRMLSRANGLIESTTFLAIILGTTCGGVLSFVFEDQEWWIGIILVNLALIGTLTSFLIHRMPPADPTRQFPGWAPQRLFKPLFQNLAVLLKGRLSSVAVLGLSFFTFMVAYMRATMYMYGQSQNPVWNEFDTSLIVAVVSLGVGLGSPLAGYISGGKVELGLVPIGALGMVLALVLASFSTFSTPGLVAALIFIGLFASFYLVPLYSMLQYSAPKGSKGASVATNNFVATTGAILASVVFGLLVAGARATGLSEPFVLTSDGGGIYTAYKGSSHHPKEVTLTLADGQPRVIAAGPVAGAAPGGGPMPHVWLRIDDKVRPGSKVAVSRYQLRDETRDYTFYHLRPADLKELPTIWNLERVPRFLFLGAAVMMFGILCALTLRLPDLFLRTSLWFRWLGRKSLLSATGQEKLTGEPVILVTNCRGLVEALYVSSSTVRPVKHVLDAADAGAGTSPWVRYLARRAGTIYYQPGDGGAVGRAAAAAAGALRGGNLVALSAAEAPERFDELFAQVQRDMPVRILPVYCRADPSADSRAPVKVVFGDFLPAGATAMEARDALRKLEPSPQPAPPGVPAEM
jgi:MFS family permease